jgi:antirestriction protein ArdC
MTNTAISESKSDVYRKVTEQIIAAIEAGAGTCKMPWHAGIVPMTMPINAATDAPYRGINVLALWADATIKRYITGYWASYKQWQKIGAQVRQGEHGSIIVFYKEYERSNSEGEDEYRPRFVARATRVFNAEQVDGWEYPSPKRSSDIELNEQVDAFVCATKADIRHNAYGARYRRREDWIELPNHDQFIGTPTSSATEAYYAVLLHELTHWTGAPHRLDRVFGTRFGDRAYAFEELIAELGAAFLCSAFRIVNEPRADHAAYISNWLGILDRDPKAIFTAASQAQKAVEYLAKLTSTSPQK